MEFNKEEWVEKQQLILEDLYTTINEMVDKTLDDKNSLSTYLSMQGRLGKTSLANTLLVVAQKSDAKYIASFEGWQEKDRSVKKGQKSISILEAGREYERKDGTIGVNFKAKKVFDVSQTRGKPLKTNAFTSNIKNHLKGEWDNTQWDSFGTFEKGCVAAILSARYGVNSDIQLPDIPDEIKTLDVQAKRELLQDIREQSLDVIERVDRAYFDERQNKRDENVR